MNKYMDALDGKTIVGIDVSQDDGDLRFRLATGEPVVWSVDGDCCSHSYWHDGYSLNALRGGAVTAVGSLDLPSPDESTYDDYIQVYGYSIVTDKGAATLAFRNSSNGYYGGSCGLGFDSGDKKWREVTGNDWQAGSKNDPPQPAPTEAEVAAAKVTKFRSDCRKGLAECRKQLRDVIPSIPSGSIAMEQLVDAIVDLQDLPTSDILILGVYLTRMAEDTLKVGTTG